MNKLLIIGLVALLLVSSVSAVLYYGGSIDAYKLGFRTPEEISKCSESFSTGERMVCLGFKPIGNNIAIVVQ